jgi:Zn-dependent protease with chaperone function
MDYVQREKGFYNNGTSSLPLPCSYTFDENKLHIFLNGLDEQKISWSLKELSSAEPNGSSFLFTNKNMASLMGTGPLAKVVFDAFQEQLRLKRERQGILSSKSIYFIIGITFSTILLGALLYLYVLPWAAEKASVLVPVDTEIALGESITDNLTGASVTNDSVNFYLEEFVKQLELDKTYPINVKVIISEEINAFAVPGGNIFIYSGLLKKMESPEELVALIGHEVTHVTERHSLKSILRSLASSLLFMLLLGDASGIASQADQFTQLDYSRALETEADKNGLAIMVKNRVQPEGMLKLLKLLKRESQEMPQLMKYLSTHPETEERIKSVEALPQSKLEFEKDARLIEGFLRIQEQVRK